MVTLTRDDVRWKFCEKPLLSLVIVYLLVLGGIGRDTTVHVAQGAEGQDELGAHQLFADVLALGIDPMAPTTLYAGVRGGGVFKSTDGGTSWQAINTGLPSTASVRIVVIHPTTPSTLYVGTDRGVFKSTDGGKAGRPTYSDQSRRWPLTRKIQPDCMPPGPVMGPPEARMRGAAGRGSTGG